MSGQNFGGRYVPECLWTPMQEVAEAYAENAGEESRRRQAEWLTRRVGRPTPLSHLVALSRDGGGAQIWAKREDLCQGGSFCATSVVSQALLAKRMGRKHLIGATATGDFGVALGSMGAALGMKVTVFIRRDDMEAELFNTARMRQLGVKVIPVAGAITGRRQAIGEALRQFSLVSDSAFYASSSLAAPNPYPRILREALQVIGSECREQLSREGIEAEYIVAPVGSGSFAAGLFGAFLADGDAPTNSQLVGVQSGGDGDSARGAAPLVNGRPGVYLGTRSMVLQDEQGQIATTPTTASGMAMPVAGPQHARWLQQGRAHYVTVSDQEALQARRRLTEEEGIFASRESGYALAYSLKLAPTLKPEQHIVVGISGSGIRELGSSLHGAEEGKPL